MKLKSYFAKSVGEAIERARGELGPEAMLLNSRKLSAEQMHLGTYEVVFGVASEVLPARKAQAPVQAAAPSQSDNFASEMAEIRRQLETMKQSIASGSAAPAGRFHPPIRPELEMLRHDLVDGGFSHALTAELIEAADKQLRAELNPFGPNSGYKNLNLPDPQTAERALLAHVESRFTVNAELGKPNSNRKVVMLVGPPGAGKTTTLVKLAVNHGLSTRTPLRVLSTDTLRVGGAEQLGSYARILGVGFEAVQTLFGLDQALEECANKRLVLIDTPGFGPADMDEAAQLAAFTRAHPELEVQLVLPAYIRSSALEKFWERFEIFSPSKLLFTHLDEIETYGGILEHAMKTGLPISFLTNGQGIPQDILEATKPSLTSWISERSAVAGLSAA